MAEYGWWVDTSKLTLSDDGTWVHALPFGTYQHPLHGELNFDTAKLTALASSVTQRTRGIDPDIDYDHKTDPAKGNQAAGWVKDAKVDQSGLHIKVDFTDTAKNEIKEKKYRYFSADFSDEWTDPQGNKHENVLNGGGLTNRPWMKNLFPVNLSELTGTPPTPPTPEVDVDLKKLRESLGLAEAATEDDVLKKLTEHTDEVKKLTDEKTALEAEVKQLKDPTPDPTKDPQLKALIEGSPAFAKMFAEMQEKDAKIAELKTAARLSEVNRQLGELQQGKTFAIAPAAREQLQAILLNAPADVSSKVVDFLAKVVDGTGLVDLSERGYRGRQDDNGDSTAKLNELVKGLMDKDAKLTYADALETVVKQHPQLFENHREHSYIVKQ